MTTSSPVLFNAPSPDISEAHHCSHGRAEDRPCLRCETGGRVIPLWEYRERLHVEGWDESDFPDGDAV